MTDKLNHEDLATKPPNDILAQLSRLQDAFKSPGDGERKERRKASRTKAESSGRRHLLACFHELLRALDWPGSQLQTAEHLPAEGELTSISDFCSVLSRLGYDCHSQISKLQDLEDHELPCLVRYQGTIFALVGRSDDGLLAFNGSTGEQETLSGGLKRQIFIPVQADEPASVRDLATGSWIGVLIAKFRSLILKLFGLTLFTNLAALAVPLFVMSVYDKAIGTRSTDTLAYFIAGIVIVLIAELGLRSIRGRALAYLGTRFEVLTSSRAFQQLLYLPITAVEDAPVSAQLTRLKQFENVREFFSGSMALALLDMPFILLFLLVIGLVGGSLVFVPIMLIAILAVMALILVPMNRRRLALTGQSRQAIQSFNLEAVQKQRVVKDNTAEEIWIGRYTDLIKLSAVRHFKSEQLNLLVMTLTQLCVAVGGAMTLYLGAVMVIGGNLSIGALIATMALVWRVMAPIQAAFLSLSRVSQVLHAFRQINYLMAAVLERQPGIVPMLARDYRGEVVLKRVSFRHSQSAEPALSGANLRAAPGEIIAVTGPTGSGKSVLLKVICGLYHSRSGSVLIDGVDLRHADPAEYRHAFGYLGESFDFFAGTIEENLVMANPTATEAQLRQAWFDAGLDDCKHVFPDAMDTYFSRSEFDGLEAGIRQRLLLARIYAKQPCLYLLDKPETGLDPKGLDHLKQKISTLRGNATVIHVTHDIAMMSSADRIVYVQDGQTLLDGPPDQVLPKIEKAA